MYLPRRFLSRGARPSRRRIRARRRRRNRPRVGARRRRRRRLSRGERARTTASIPIRRPVRRRRRAGRRRRRGCGAAILRRARRRRGRARGARGADVERGGRVCRRQLVGVRQSHHHARREGGSERADDEIDRLFVLEADSTIGGDVGVHHGVVIGDVGGEFAEDAGGGAPFDVEESGRVPHRHRVRVVELVLEAKTLGGANLERADGRVAVHQRVDHGGLTNPGLAQHEHAELVARVQPSALVVREVQIETNGRVDGGRRRRAGVGRGGATPTRTTTRTARSGTNRRARRRETNERARRHGTTATTAPGCYLSCAPDICR